MKKIWLFNTLGGRLEQLRPVSPPIVKIYTCGPTVYSHTHLGHMRTYTNADTLIRTLKYFGYQTKRVMNITDVGHLTNDQDMGEDKLEKAARKERKTAWEISEEYAKEFFTVLEKLNTIPPDVATKATDNIAQMILLVQELEKKGFTYRTDDGLYFDTSKFPAYGQLANVSLADLEEGARVEKNPQKKHPTDFALWKFTAPGEGRQMEWPSPWSKKSFPGWHIECSTMAMRYLSDCFQDSKFYPERFKTIDIHTGGIEHINIHHSNEIAQTEAATGKKFANYWIHFHWLQVDGRKMSKSLGNFYTLKDLADRGYDNLMSLRYLFLNTHYRKTLNFTWEALLGAGDTYSQMIRDLKGILLFEDVSRRANRRTGASSEESTAGKEALSSYTQKFDRALACDLNTPQALAVIHQVLKDKSLGFKGKRDLIINFDQVLGLDLIAQAEKLVDSEKKVDLPEEIEQLVKDREVARQGRDWDRADQLRLALEKSGYLIEDTPSGPKLTAKK